MDRDVKRRTLYLSKILLERTDELNSLSTGDLIKILKNEYHISSHRTTVAADIQTLIDFGMDIQVTKSRPVRYNVVSRQFDYAELKLIIDAIESAKFISKKRSVQLVEKVTALAGRNKAEELKRNIFVESRIKSENEHTIYIIDAINDAINQRKQIRFQYYQYNEKKELVPRHDGYWYCVSPYRLVWNGDYYYVLGYSEKYKNIGSFRIDRMISAPEITDVNALPLPQECDLDRYLNSMFRMFSTERETVSLICENDCMDSIIDRFGEDVQTYAYDAEHFKAEIEIAVNNVFYSWIFGFSGKVTISGPGKVQKAYRDMLQQAVKQCERK